VPVMVGVGSGPGVSCAKVGRTGSHRTIKTPWAVVFRRWLEGIAVPIRPEWIGATRHWKNFNGLGLKRLVASGISYGGFKGDC
jgi:hypothetical protein